VSYSLDWSLRREEKEVIYSSKRKIDCGKEEIIDFTWFVVNSDSVRRIP